MPVNYWLYQMGRVKSHGHLPVYSLTFVEKLLTYYDMYLSKPLSLRTDNNQRDTDTKTDKSNIQNGSFDIEQALKQLSSEFEKLKQAMLQNLNT